MAGVDARQQVPARNPYLVLLRTPGAPAFSASGFVGRMSMSMYGLGTVLLISSLTGRYGAAGTVAGAGSVGYAACSPYIAKLADRLGQRRVLLSQVVIFTFVCLAFIVSAEMRAPFPALLATGAVAGAFMPSTGSMVRSRWSWLLGDDSRRLQAAFALESVNDELIFVVGPALVTLLATQVFPASGVGTAGLLAVAGTTVFALQRRTEPPPRPRPAPAAAPEALATLAGPAPRPRPGRGRQSWRSRLPTVPAPALVTLSPAFFLLGAMFVTVDLSSVGFATELGHRPLAGLILGTYALGSAIGGLWYGSRHWRAPLGRRFITTATLVVAGVTTFIAMPNLPALDAACLVAGLSIAPTLIAGYAILERQAMPHRRTEAMAWLSSTISVGVALGSSVTGQLLDAYGAKAGYIFGACCGSLAVLICLAGRRRLATDEDRAPAADRVPQEWGGTA
jgi:MFS family permease